MQEEFFSSVEEFVEFSGGNHVIKKILIANNGIGAVKAIRSIRKWAYHTFGNERMIKFVAMATPDDLRANAEFIRLADEVVNVPGGTNNNNYANVNLICEIAERLCVDAVMPLWGHASENPAFPASLLKLKRKIVFAGPPAAPMHALGDKIGSTIIAQSAGVPTIAWNGQDLRVDYARDGCIAPEIYDAANVKTAQQAVDCATRVGFPVMIKASAGGGGKGIRQVSKVEDVASAFRQVQGEVPGSPVFIMKLATHSRHLEVQLFADKYGNAIALSGRDCSVQRRHQKIIEEGPPLIAPPEVFKRMEKSAIALAKEVGYQSLGTLEFLFHMDTHTYSFLELNPRLQVEHPVTENILGINLPACQIQVAMGLPLHRIADIRRIYGRHPRGNDTIDFEYSERVPLTGYCIATRITAENPDASFQPTSGKIREIQFRPSIDVWGYFSVNSSGLIHEFSDSQFGHLFAHGKDRESARRAMVVALKELEIRGEMRTTVEYLIRLLESDDYIHDRISTQWLDARIAHQKELKSIEAKAIPPRLVAICGGVVQGFKHFEAARASFLESLRIGQVPSKDAIIKSEKIELIYDNIKYTMKCSRSGLNSVIISNDIQSEEISIRLMSDGGYLLNIRGTSRRVYMQNEGAGSLRMGIDGATFIFTPEYDPTCLRASVAGKIARLLISDGSHVNAGEPFVEIEVMKMYMPLKAEEPGFVHFQLSEGAVISPGDIIASIDLDFPDKVVKAEVFSGNIFDFDDGNKDINNDINNKDSEILPHLIYKSSREQLEKVLDGYSLSEAEIDQALATCTGALMNKMLPAYELREAISVLEGRIDADLFDRIIKLNEDYIEDVRKDEITAKFPSGKIITAIWELVQSNPVESRATIMTKLASVWEICEVNFHCSEVQILVMLIKFTEKFLQVENIFDDLSYSDVINRLRKIYPGESNSIVWDLCSSHVNLEDKTILMLKVIDIMVRIPVSVANQRPKYPSGIPLIHEINPRNLKVKLIELSRLRQSVYSRLSFAANIALMKQNTLTVDQRRTRLHEVLVQALSTGDKIGCGERVHYMKSFVESNIAILDLFTESMQEDPEYQIAYLELYLRKIYQKTHDMLNLSAGHTLSSDKITTIPWIKFEFRTRTFGAITAPEGSRNFNLTYNDLANLSRTSDSYTNLVSDSEEEGISTSAVNVIESTRYGAFAVFTSPEEFCSQFSLLLEKIPQSRAITPLKKSPVNALHAVFLKHNFSSIEESTTYISSFLSNIQEDLKDHGIRRVTVLMGKVDDGSLPKHITKIDPHANNMMSILTFRNTNNYHEDTLYRNIEAPHAYHLDLQRLSNFSITLEEGLQTSSGNVQLYRAIPNGEIGPISYFARLVSFTADERSSEAESFFVEALDAIALAIGRDENNIEIRTKKTNLIPSNHIFLNIVAPDVVIQPDFYEGEMRRICTKYSEKMVKLIVSNVELKLACRLHADADPISIRFNITNPTGYVINIEQYYEELSKGITIFRGVDGNGAKYEWDGLPVTTPYPISRKFDVERSKALLSSDTLYVYDWPLLFEYALKTEWKKFIKSRPHLKKEGIPDDIFIYEELVFDETNTKLYPIKREPGLNKIGMVGWLVTMKTPEFRNQPRQIVIIANDITIEAGSFGTTEDFFFASATQYARNLQIPRIYLAANSGARIGMAQSLKDKFSVCWNDDNDPTKGFQYIYLTQIIYEQLLQKVNGDLKLMPVICSNPPITGPNGELRYIITDIIGEETDLGVENLMGSGLIAGETSRAYNDIFTLTLVVGRTVGIGAYLVRLGQRTIQKTRNSPIILTGYQALNKLLGKEIYTTNDQLGGPMIMFPNGVTHMLAETHLDSVKKALTWLSFVPASNTSHLPIQDITGIDVIDRLVEYCPKKGISYDPRLLITGNIINEGTSNEIWESGLFDKDSFIEVLGGWAKTVVTGRARLGGIPMGIIVTENRTSEAFILADPADPTSQEKIIQQAGGVWFPDSAYKTAQALRDFNHEKLPCFVFANWRGFSGGQRDMYDEVLKFGSMIVDALVEYQQPLFVYIPPFAELRGGAWVVVDHTINNDVMEFYAAEDARGGVLEATGIASIKYRDPEIKATAHRLDHVLIKLKEELKLAIDSNDDELKKKIEKQIQNREKILMGVYRQISVHFADLHDTPGRMQAKGVIRKQVTWAQSRKFFFWRLRRRLAEFEVVNNILETDKSIKSKEIAVQIIQQWYLEAGGSLLTWDDDRKVMLWLQDNTQLLRDKLIQLKSQVQTNLLSLQFSSILQDAENSSQVSAEDIISKAITSLSETEVSKLKAIFASLK